LPQAERDDLRRRRVSAQSVIGLWEFDHVVLHAFGGADEWWNLDPKLKAVHREKSRRDTSIVAKTKRIEANVELHNARMKELGKLVADQVVQDYSKLRLFRAKRKWPKRSFPQRYKEGRRK